jgi:hypothetical protein
MKKKARANREYLGIEAPLESASVTIESLSAWLGFDKDVPRNRN